jgi:hypothetical protein
MRRWSASPDEVAGVTRTGFVPSVNGLHYDNAFPDGPALTVDLGVTTLNIGNAANGLCGGMVFAALDYWSFGGRPPPDTTPPAKATPAFQYLVRRLIDSWGLPNGPLSYLTQMNPMYPDGDEGIGPVKVHGRAWRLVTREWPAVRTSIDAGQPCPLGLVKLVSANPMDIGKNHQVLAYDYQLSNTSVSLAVYDPNQADRDDVVITLELGDPTRPVRLSMAPDTSAVAGLVSFFKVAYSPKRPPPLG